MARRRVAEGAPGFEEYGATQAARGQRIADLLPEERPRERLERHGAEALSTAELMAILFRTGTQDRNAVQVAHELFRTVGDLAEAARASLEELMRVPGIGRVKAIEVKAAMELGKRLAAASEDARPVIRTPEDAARLLMAELRYETREHVVLLVLDARQRVRRQVRVSTGTLTESLIHPREVFAEAIRHHAAAVILVHNHPSGDPSPSADDLAITRRLGEAGRLLGIELLDHVIIGDGRFVSLKSDGLLA